MAVTEWTIRRTENSIYRWHHPTINAKNLETRRIETLVEDFSDARRAALMKELRAECRPFRLEVTHHEIEPKMTVYQLAELVHESLREVAVPRT